MADSEHDEVITLAAPRDFNVITMDTVRDFLTDGGLSESDNDNVDNTNVTSLVTQNDRFITVMDICREFIQTSLSTDFDTAFVGFVTFLQTVDLQLDRGLRILDIDIPTIISSRADLEPVPDATDTDIKLLAEWEGNDGDTTFVDSSTSNHTIALDLDGDELAEISTDFARHGNTSLKLKADSGGGPTQGNIVITNQGTEFILDDTTIEWDFLMSSLMSSGEIQFWQRGCAGVCNSYVQMNLVYVSVGTYKFQIVTRRLGGAGSSLTSSNFSLSTSVWYHVAVVFDGRLDVKVYLDEDIIVDGTLTTNPDQHASTPDVYIAILFDNNFFLYVDRYVLTQRVLTPSEFMFPQKRPMVFNDRTDGDSVNFFSVSDIDVKLEDEAEVVGENNQDTNSNEFSVAVSVAESIIAMDESRNYIDTGMSSEITGDVDGTPI